MTLVSRLLKHTGIFICQGLLFLFCWVAATTAAHAQAIKLIPNVDEEHYGFQEQMIEFNDSLYFNYYDNYGDFIAQLSGDTIRLLTQPADIFGYPTVYNNKLYWIFQAGKKKLGRINADGTTTLIENPDNAPGYTGKPIEYNGKLYTPYLTSFQGTSLAVFDGSNTTILEKPDPGPGFWSSPLINDGALYWIYKTSTQKYLLSRYDGNILSIIGNAGAGQGIRSEFGLTVYNNKVFFVFNDSLVYFNGTAFTSITMPAGISNFGSPVAHAGKLWFSTRSSNNLYQLANYNDTAVTMFGSTYSHPLGFGFPFEYQGKLHFRMDSTLPVHNLARIDADSIKKFPRIHPSDPGFTGPATVYNDNLYISYAKNGSEGVINLARVDGENFYLFPHPPESRGMITREQNPLVHKGSLFFGYVIPGVGQYASVVLAKLTDTIIVNKICPGASISLSSEISGATYQWQVNDGGGFVNISNNTNYAGANSSNLSISSIPSSWYGYRYRCIADNVYSQRHTLQFSNNFTGAVNNLWSNPANWSCGVVPDQFTDVTISSGSIIVDINCTIRSLNIISPATVTVQPAVVLTVLQ